MGAYDVKRNVIPTNVSTRLTTNQHMQKAIVQTSAEKNLQKRWIENHSYCIQYSRSISLSLCLLAVCYDGPLDLVGELHVYPENVSFASLQVLLKENR